MSDFIIENGVLRKYTGSGGDVTVPQGVSVLADSFFLCRDVTSVVLPEGVKVIEPAAFYLCDSLRSVIFPKSLQVIGTTAFLGCRSLETVTIPGSVETVGARAFLACGLRTVIIENGVKTLEAGIFRNCELLVELRLPESLQIIGPGVFYGCASLRRVKLPASVTKLGVGAFGECESLEELVAPGMSIEALREQKLALIGAMGYLCDPDAYTDPEILRQYRQYITLQRKAVMARLAKLDRAEGLKTYAALNKINIRNFDSDFLQPAIEAGATACTAFLMEWKKQNVSDDAAAKQWAQDWKL